MCKRKKSLVALAIILVIICFFAAAAGIKLFDVLREAPDIKEASQSTNVSYLLKYSFTTGAGWKIIDCSEKEYIGENVAVKTAFDPRYLRCNKDFSLDYCAKLYVEGKPIDTVLLYSEKTLFIDAHSIAVVDEGNVFEKDAFRLKDLSAVGFFRIFLGLFDNRANFSY